MQAKAKKAKKQSETPSRTPPNGVQKPQDERNGAAKEKLRTDEFEAKTA